MKKIILFITVFTLPLFFCERWPGSPSKLLEKYYAYLEKDDVESASKLWHDSFGCDYDLIDWHFAPPLTNRASLYASYQRSITVIRVDDTKALMKLAFISNEDDTLELDYYAKNFIDKWKLVNPPDIECVGWDSVLTDDLVIRHNPIYSFSGAFYSSLRSLYGRIKILLGYEGNAKRQVFLAPSDVGVSVLSYSPRLVQARSFSACGIVFSRYILKSRHRDIINISARLVGHELVHIVAFDVFGHDGYSVPFLREGLATYFCGTGGVLAEVCMSRAVNMVDSLPSLSDLLDSDVFYSGEDLHYGAAATFVDFLVKNYGWDKLKEIYRESSTIEGFMVTVSSIDNLESLDIKWKDYIKELSIKIPKTWQDITDFDL